MTAWQLLIQKSSLAVATAWEHLNNQISGDVTVIIGGKRTANIALSLSANINSKITASIVNKKHTANKSMILSANIATTREATLCH